jgi:hypothetical protein
MFLLSYPPPPPSSKYPTPVSLPASSPYPPPPPHPLKTLRPCFCPCCLRPPPVENLTPLFLTLLSSSLPPKITRPLFLSMLSSYPLPLRNLRPCSSPWSLHSPLLLGIQRPYFCPWFLFVKCSCFLLALLIPLPFLLSPQPLTARLVCIPPPLVRGEDTLAPWRGGGGSIVRKTPDTGLYSIYVSTLWF